jgi:hypothetical protein
MARRQPPDTTNIDAYRRYVREALAEGLPVDMDAVTRRRVYRSAGWQAALSIRGRTPRGKKKL